MRPRAGRLLLLLALVAAPLAARPEGPGEPEPTATPRGGPEPRSAASPAEPPVETGEAEPEEPVPSEAEALIEMGWRKLHDLDVEGAARAFRELQKLTPISPLGYLYEATALWLGEVERRGALDINQYIDSRHFADPDLRVLSPELERHFDQLMDRALRLAQAQVGASSPPRVDDLYVLATVHGLKGSFNATIRHDTSSALTDAREAWRLQKQVVAADPEYWDAYLTVGLYEYITGSLPVPIRWFAAIAGFRGNKAEGIKKVEKAAFLGRSVGQDAMSILAVLYIRENRAEDALPLLSRLKTLSPRNYALRLNEAYVLQRLDRYLEAARSYDEALRAARPGAPLERELVRLQQAYCLMQGGEAQEALDLAQALLDDPGLREGVHTRARLLAGQALDSLGRRAEATERYRAVVKAPDVDGSRGQARNLIRRPFVPLTPPAVVEPPPAAEPPPAGSLPGTDPRD